MFNSQSGEDRELYNKYLNYESGFFIELGAMNGIIYSNTLFFENNLNWTGVLIEPTNQFESLVNNRPNCKNFNYAVSKVNGLVEFIGNYACGGIASTMPEGHRTGNNLGDDKYLVKSMPISDILKDLSIERVDLFSIDVEGGELEVLETFDWNIPVYIVLIEMSRYNLEKDDMCRNFLKSKGFELDTDLIINSGCEEVWINKKYDNYCHNIKK
jgi:FkbM family methyltransferase